MANRIIVFLLAISLFSCSNALQTKPTDLIEKDKMVLILTDLYIAEGLTSSSFLMKEFSSLPRNTFYNHIYKKYKVNRLQFDASLKFYSDDISSFEGLYQEVVNNLSKKEKELAKKSKKTSMDN